MPLYYRKRIKILPGIYINLTKSGLGISFGSKGFHYSISPKGRRSVSAGIPGSGLYWRKQLSKWKRKNKEE